MKTTPYFDQQVRRKRPYLKVEWILSVIAQPVHTTRQADGRVRMWGYIPELGHFLRVVTLDDGETVHNAFPDRNFSGPA